MHLQRNTEGKQTQTHTREGAGWGGITSSYSTAKAKAWQLEVHGNMEHCPDIVDSSVFGCWATPKSHAVRPGCTIPGDPFSTRWCWSFFFPPQSQMTVLQTSVYVSEEMCSLGPTWWLSEQTTFNLTHHWPASQPLFTSTRSPSRAHDNPRLTIILAMFCTVSSCKHATYTQKLLPQESWMQKCTLGYNKHWNRKGYELTSHQNYWWK